MSLFMGLRHRLHALLFPRAHARDAEEEMQMHMELDTMHQGEAREAALRFGNRTYYREEVRRMTWYGALDVARQDASYAWRNIRRSPGLTCMVVLTLALGIGVNAASFSLLDVLFLREPTGIVNPSEVRRLHVQHFRTGDGVPFFSQSLSYPAYQEMVAAIGDSTRTALHTTESSLRLGKHPRDPKVRGVYASANYFPLLGVRTVLGRVFNAEEDRLGAGSPVVVVSHRFWQSQLGADSSAIGRTIDVSGARYTVIGVLDPAFTGVDLQGAELWMPLATLPAPSWMKGPWWKESLNMMRFQTIYRLAPGMSEQGVALRATQRMRAFEQVVSPKRPDTLMTMYSGPLLEARGPGKQRPESLIASRLSGVALIVLLIACANVINLLLARAVRRRHEFSIRLALGMSRSRLVRLLTTETLLLALVATIPAVLAAWWGGNVLRVLLLPNMEWHEGAMTGRVVVFAFGLALLAGVIAGIVPALQASRPELIGSLNAAARSGGGHRSRLRTSLVIAQAALTLVLLTGSALFVRSLRNVQAIDIGFDPGSVVFGGVAFAKGESPPGAVVDAGMRDIGARLEGQGAAVSSALTWFEPMRGLSWLDFFTAHDSSESFKRGQPTASHVSPSFFATVGLRLLQGRTFNGGNGSSAPHEVLVNDAMAKRLWPGENAIGQCMYFKKRDTPCHQVVGVVENSNQNKLIEVEPALQYYVPLASEPDQAYGATLIVRTRGETTDATVTALQSAIREAFPAGEPVVTTMMANLEPEYRPWKLGATLFTATGVLALVVALIGIYSTVSYGVAQRTHEFGVRIALGAQLADLVRQVVGEGVRVVVVGIVTGVLLALAAGRLLASLLYGVSANDPATMAGVAALMLLVTVMAAIVPAWRAARVDPVRALRAD